MATTNPTFYAISFDCAIETLAYVILSSSKPIKDTIKASGDIITECDIKLIDAKVISLRKLAASTNAPFNNITDTIRVLVALSDTSFDCINGNPVDIYIEDQPPLKYDNIIIQSALTTYFISRNIHITIHQIPPAIKTQFAFTPNLRLSAIMPMYKTTYSANKKCTELNFKHFCDHNQIKLDIANMLLNHVGDAFMQVIAFHLHTGNKSKREFI